MASVVVGCMPWCVHACDVLLVAVSSNVPATRQKKGASLLCGLAGWGRDSEVVYQFCLGCCCYGSHLRVPPTSSIHT